MTRRRLALATLTALVLVAPLGAASADPGGTAGTDLTRVEGREWTSLPPTALPEGDPGVKRIAVTSDGTRAVLLQSYATTSRLVNLDITTSPATVLGVNSSVQADVDSDLEVRGRFVYSTYDDVLQVSTIKNNQPTLLRRVTVGTSNDMWDLAISPNGKYLYATSFAITWPADKMYVFRIRPNGIPKKVGVVKRFALGRIEITPNGKTLVGIDEIHDRVVTYSLRKPAKPKLTGRAFPTGIDDAENLAVAPGSRYVYLAGGTTADVAKVDLKRRRTVHTRQLSTDSGGDIAVTANGSVVTTLSRSQGDETGLVIMNGNLRPVSEWSGLCFAQGVAASWAGPTKGRAYVGDSGICDRAGFYPLAP